MKAEIAAKGIDLGALAEVPANLAKDASEEAASE